MGVSEADVVECEGEDGEAEDDVGVVLRWARVGSAGFDVVDVEAEEDLDDVEDEKRQADFLESCENKKILSE